jgi:hypothetical protein
MKKNNRNQRLKKKLKGKDKKKWLHSKKSLVKGGINE